MKKELVVEKSAENKMQIKMNESGVIIWLNGLWILDASTVIDDGEIIINWNDCKKISDSDKLELKVIGWPNDQNLVSCDPPQRSP